MKFFFDYFGICPCFNISMYGGGNVLYEKKNSQKRDKKMPRPTAGGGGEGGVGRPPC